MLFASVTATVDNTIAGITANDVTCSMAGGCQFVVNTSGPGLATAMKNGAAKILVAGEECELDSDNSSLTSTICYLPMVHSHKSIDEFTLVEAEAIVGSSFADSSAEDVEAPWDGINQKNYVSSAADCHFGTSFDAGYRGLLKSA